MIPVESRHPPGIVGVGTGHLARYAEFQQSLAQVYVPAGSALCWIKGPSIARNCNEMVRELLANPALQWLWIQGDDHVFEPDLLLKLLAHDVDMVAPMVSNREPGYILLAFEDADEWRTLAWDKAPRSGLLKIRATGSGGLLIRRRVLEAMLPPYYFESQPENGWGEDTAFCDKARAKGFDLYLDSGTSMGHTTNICVWPKQAADGSWGLRLQLSQAEHVDIRP